MLIGIVIALPCVAAGNEFSYSKQVKLNLIQNFYKVYYFLKENIIKTK